METLEAPAVDYFQVITYTGCSYRNGLTCGATREKHPLVSGPEGAHEFVGGEAIRRVKTLEEFELLKQLAELRGETFRTFVTAPKGARPWESGAPEGRLDANGERWWACDGYPTWYRWDATPEGPELRRKAASVEWA